MRSLVFTVLDAGRTPHGGRSTNDDVGALRSLCVEMFFGRVFIAVHFEKSKAVQDFGKNETKLFGKDHIPLTAAIMQQRCMCFTFQPASFRIEGRVTNYEQTQ